MRNGWAGLLVSALLLGSAAAAPKGAAPKMSNDECLACHANAGLTKEVNGKQVSLDIHGDKFKASAHGVFGCTDCHTDVAAFPHDPAPRKPDCATCHSDEAAAYNRGFHAKAIQNGVARAATCQDCHGSVHELLPASDPNSKVNHLNIPATCGSCHGQRFVMENTGVSTQPFVQYEQSVHGKNVAGGNTKAAVCTDCHGTHEILSASNPQSPIFKFNVPNTCGQCHGEVKQQYVASIHGQAMQRGVWQAPVCTDCHGIHSIKAPTDPSSSVAAQALARTTCARCHEGERLATEFGVPGERVKTYLASYHGLASKLGSTVVANCASCHGVHNIFPSSDPRSTVNRANLAQTCGQCHPGVSDKFVQGKIHIEAPLSADIGSVAVRWIRRFYLGMILATIGGMLLHNFIIWRRKAQARKDQHHRLVRRMTRNQQAQHLILLLSFFTLVVTGFALKFPDSWFAALLGLSESVRGILHRTAGVVLIGVAVYHLGYLAISRDGRKLFQAMMPEPKDATDLIGTMRYYLGFGGARPRYGRFNYAEKAEYLALVWGTVVMALTGLALWFKVIVGDLLPRWWLDIATAIHFYEAILATLAIPAWHFYQVMFDPDVYPMNWAWYDGKVSIEHYSEEHGLDTETLRAALADREAPAPAPQPEAPAAEPAEEGEPVSAERRD